MKVISIVARKGGVGKTTIALHLAAGLARRGYRVGLVDADSQGNCGVWLNQPTERGLYEVMVHHAPVDTIAWPIEERFWLLPGNERTYQIADHLDDAFAFINLTEAFGERCALDYIVVDTPPTIAKLDGAVWLATDYHLFVVECDRLSFEGLQTALVQFSVVAANRQRYLDRPARVLGIVPNKFRANTTIHRHNISELGRLFGTELVCPPVTLRTAWVEALNEQQLIYDYAPNGTEATDAWALVDRTIQAVNHG